MKKILLTNNDLTYPVLHTQLLRLYHSNHFEKKLYCKNKTSSSLAGFTIVPLDKTSSALLNYILYIFAVKRDIQDAENDTTFHVRGYVAGVVLFIAMILSARVPAYIYDPRGAFIMEKNESGSLLRHIGFLMSLVEKHLIRHSVRTIVTSEKFRRLFHETYGFFEKYQVVYNCTPYQRLPREFDLNSLQEINVIYVGTVNHWHDISEICNVLRRVRSVLANKRLILYFLTAVKNHGLVSNYINDLGFDQVKLDFIPLDEIEESVQQMHIGISVVRPTPSGVIASPIKISDYIRANLVIVANRGIGDFDEHFTNQRSAVLYDYGRPEFSLDDLCMVNPKMNETLDGLIVCGGLDA